MDAWDASGWDKGAGMLAIFMGQVISTREPPRHDDGDDDGDGDRHGGDGGRNVG